MVAKPVWWQSLCGGKACVVACALSNLATAARAGSWEVITSNEIPANQVTLNNWSKIRKGVTKGESWHEDFTGISQNTTPPFERSWESGLGWPTLVPGQTSSGHIGDVGKQFASYDGKVCVILNWKPATDKPNEEPPLFVAVTMHASVKAKATTKGDFAHFLHVDALIKRTDGSVGDVNDDDGGAVIDLQLGEVAPPTSNSVDPHVLESSGFKAFFMLVPTLGRTHIELPLVHLKAVATADGNRKAIISVPDGRGGTSQQTARYQGTAEANLTFVGSDVAFQLTPDPDALALMDCEHPELSVVNQYVMSGAGGAPFTIDCRAHLGVLSNLFDNQLRDGFSWEIERAPLPMLTTAPNGFASQIWYTGGTAVWRRSYPPDPASPTPIPGGTPQPAPTPSATPSATPLDGMGFDTRGGLPNANSAFGLNTISHLFGDPAVQGPPKLIAAAPIALFYDATAKTHAGENVPAGTASDGTPTKTANFFYYYKQVIGVAPYGATVLYKEVDASNTTNLGNTPSYSYQDAFGQTKLAMPTHIEITQNCHGTHLLPYFQSVPVRQNDGSLKNELRFVGYYRKSGIDLFLKTCKHESKHYEIYHKLGADYFNGPRKPTGELIGDEDSDGVPDADEAIYGLDPNDADSTKYNSHGAYGGGPGNAADFEVIAALAANGVGASATQVESDWASDGLNKAPNATICDLNAPPVMYADLDPATHSEYPD